MDAETPHPRSSESGAREEDGPGDGAEAAPAAPPAEADGGSPPRRPAKPAARTRAAAAAASPTTAAPRSTGRTAPRSTSSRSASTSPRTRKPRASVPPPKETESTPDAPLTPSAPTAPAALPVEAAAAVPVAEVEGAAEPTVIVEPVDVEPDVIEPVVLEPVVVEPVSVEPVAVEPEPEPVAVEPEPEPVIVEPVAVVEPETLPAVEAEPEPVALLEPEPEPEPEHPAVFGELLHPGATEENRRSALRMSGVTKRYGSVTAVDGIDLDIPAGSFYGIVGPNGAGKTTTLSIATGLLRPDAGSVEVYGADVWRDPDVAKQYLGVLPDRLRLFDRLTGAQLLHYAGSLRGLDPATTARRAGDLARAFGLTSSLGRLVSDYSVGMTKKVAIAAALIHSPRMLVLDEPFESVDPVSTAAVLRVLRRFTAGGGTVLLSSHNMELIESACDSLAIVVGGRVLAAGPTTDVLEGVSLEDRFVELAGGRSAVEGLEWLHSYSD